MNLLNIVNGCDKVVDHIAYGYYLLSTVRSPETVQNAYDKIKDEMVDSMETLEKTKLILNLIKMNNIYSKQERDCIDEIVQSIEKTSAAFIHFMK